MQWGLLLPLLISDRQGRVAWAWNSFASNSQTYSFQEFYTDAQYGPDFGYYSTGAILQEDGPVISCQGQADRKQEWFNSYTTFPMALSPDFGHALCDRLVTMWQAMDRPPRIILVEFGGGTGMLARDILQRSRDSHPEFYETLVRYVIAERSQELRKTQLRTASEFVASGKLAVVEADARQASLLRPVLEEMVGTGQTTVGFVLSNELLDEFDPVRLRLVWRSDESPSARRCAECDAYREAHVLHRIDEEALKLLLHGGDHFQNDSSMPVSPKVAASVSSIDIDELRWEGEVLHCGLLGTESLRQAMLAVASELTAQERMMCAPQLVCCSPFLVAVNHALMFNYEALNSTHVLRKSEDGGGELLNLYRHHLQRINGSIPLSKHRYRQLRRLASMRGQKVERDLLMGADDSAHPSRLHSEEVFLALRPDRCVELRGWMRRHSERLAVAAQLRNGVASLFDGDALLGRTSQYLKLVLRPGEAQFVEQAGLLLDEGFLVTLDYGADADALMWQSLVRPNHEGVNIVDARDELSKCTAGSYLECPGLQDLTTSVDFTEVASAGRELGSWEVLAYGPIFLLELSFQGTKLELAATGDPMRLGHLVERAYGVRTAGLSAWYQKQENDPWASFKVMVQHRGSRGSGWTLGALSNEWPLLQMQTRLGHSRDITRPTDTPCWGSDITKPPLASFIAASAHRAMVNTTVSDDAAAYTNMTPAEELDADAQKARELASRQVQSSARADSESPKVHAVLLEQFQSLLEQSGGELVEVLKEQHLAQRQQYADAHLALLLVDYWHLIQEAAGESEDSLEVLNRLDEVRTIATSRRLPDIYGEDAFDRVLEDVQLIIRNTTSLTQSSNAPHACLAGRSLYGPMYASAAVA
jgi:SAM-dependent MidA family methyltransferase